MEMNWISVKDALPKKIYRWGSSYTVLICENGYTALGFYVFDPKKWGCMEDDEEILESMADKRYCGIEEPHWHQEGWRYNFEGGEMMGPLDEDNITHWIPLPKPPMKAKHPKFPKPV